MQVGDFGDLGAPRIDDDQLPQRISLDPVQLVTRVGKAVRKSGIAADREQQITVMHIFRRVARLAAEQVAVEPEVSGLLLRQGVEDVA